ncbi:MAG: HAD family hydrolase [Bacteroidota bacterium]
MGSNIATGANIFVTDLDGTLLRNNTTVSPPATQTLTHLLQQQAPISIATARSIVSVRQILGHIPFQLPIVCANGAYVTNLADNQREFIQDIPQSLAEDLLELGIEWGFSPLISTYSYAAQRELLYVQDVNNHPLRTYIEDRQQTKDERLTFTPSIRSCLKDAVLNLNLMAERPRVIELMGEIKRRYPGLIQCYTYEGFAGDQYVWLSVYAQGATKGLALKRWLEGHGHDPAQLVVFGDQLNDCSMFEVAGKAVAVADAHPGLKVLADEVIGSNEEDAVVAYIANWLQD